jgi:hypothetical protein
LRAPCFNLTSFRGTTKPQQSLVSAFSEEKYFAAEMGAAFLCDLKALLCHLNAVSVFTRHLKALLCHRNTARVFPRHLKAFLCH